MKFIQFFSRDLSGAVCEMLGDRSVIIVDGRRSPATVREIAEYDGPKRGAVAWQVFKGDTFSRSAPISGRWFFPNSKTDNTAASAYRGN